MDTQHEKSPCCGGRIIHFGERRRQCASCKKTWRVWRRRRGRKKKRNNLLLVFQYLDGNFVSIKKEAKRKRIHESALRRQLKRSAQHFIETTAWEKVPANRRYILMADAVVKRIRRQWYTVYIVAAKQPHRSTAVVLPPVVLHWERNLPRMEICA